MKQFRHILAQDVTASSLQQEIATHGYALVRGWMPAADLAPLLAEIAAIVVAAGWLLPGTDPLQRMANPAATCGDPDQPYRDAYKTIFSLQSLHAFAHRTRLRQLMHLLAGPELLIHPKPIARVIFPNAPRFTTHVHQDNTAIGGDSESFTAWTPLHHCPAELGPLQLLEGSHRFGLQCADHGLADPATLRGGDWVSGDLHAGDVLLFHSLTAHAGTPNLSTQLRISVDCRFQDVARAIHPAALVFPGPSTNRRSWQATYANWPAGPNSDALKFYWQRLPLRLKPSRAQLAELAQTDERPEVRARYARTLAQIEEQGVT